MQKLKSTFFLVALLFISIFILQLSTGSQSAESAPQVDVYAFIHAADTQFRAENVANPTQLTAHSNEAITNWVDMMATFPGSAIPAALGGGTVATDILGMIVAGDLIDSLDHTTGNHPAVSQVEWDAFKTIFGLDGTDGMVPFPMFEEWGNHDGPAGDTFLVNEMIARTAIRPNIVNISPNGMHYSWDWGGVHFVNLGIFVGDTDDARPGHNYAPRESLQFLRDDLASQVGDSGRPIFVSHHFHVDVGDNVWPDEDNQAFWDELQNYQVAAVAHGHKHTSPPRFRYWDGTTASESMVAGPGLLPLLDPDDISAPNNLSHGFMYIEIHNGLGIDDDKMVVRSYFTDDNWNNSEWGQRWEIELDIPEVLTPVTTVVPTATMQSWLPALSFAGLLLAGASLALWRRHVHV